MNALFNRSCMNYEGKVCQDTLPYAYYDFIEICFF